MKLAKPISTKPGGERKHVTKAQHTVACGVPTYQKKKNGLAGGDTGKWKNPQEDCLPGQKGK